MDNTVLYFFNLITSVGNYLYEQCEFTIQNPC